MLPELYDLFRYNRWANERLIDACTRLPDEHIHRELGGSFPSIWVTLAHLYGAEYGWFERWQGTPRAAPSDLGDARDLATLATKWTALWQRQSAWLNSLGEEQVRADVHVILRSGRDFRQQLGATMRHCMNHATYHRGQVTNFIRMLGGEAVPLDLVIYYIDHPPSA